MIRISPSIRISLALVLIAVSVLLFGNMIGLIPDRSIVLIETRKNIARSLAMQCSMAAQDSNIFGLRKTMDAIVEMHPEVLSLGLRDHEGEKYLAQTQGHSNHWVAMSGFTSTPTHWQLPIHQADKVWGTLEISFKSQALDYVFGYTLNPIYLLLTFFGFVSFLVFLIYMKNVLRHLDPTTVMPSRVIKMLDTLTEGVILMDNKEQIILANSSFAKDIGQTSSSLMGLKISELEWVDHQTRKRYELHPWRDAISQKRTQSNIQIGLSTLNGLRKYHANFTPIFDDKKNCRGSLATFDDLTELERTNTKLNRMLSQLEKSQEEIQLQNKKLKILATHDSLTGCLNRRAFYKEAQKLIEEAYANGSALSCIMSDIDLFKSVNDNYGHAIGDQIIQSFVKTINSVVKGSDAVGRYGGEEFCIFLPNCSMADAAQIADHIREKVITDSSTALQEVPNFSITGSFGVSDLFCGARSVEELIDQADIALYNAKEEGRNRVICWKRKKQFQSAS